jgi:TonB family protein
MRYQRIFLSLAILLAAASEAFAVDAQHAPSAAATVHTCNNLIPPAIAELQSNITTLLAVRVATDGTIHDASIYKSSGNADFDQAALTCSNGADVAPLVHDGAPVEANWIVSAHWQPGLPFMIYTASAGGPELQMCSIRDYPAEAVHQHLQGTSHITYVIGTDGTVQNTSVTNSSGFKILDDAAVQCVAQWHFYPVTQSGHAIDVENEAYISWNLKTPSFPRPSRPPTYAELPPDSRDVAATQNENVRSCDNLLSPAIERAQEPLTTLMYAYIYKDGAMQFARMYRASGNEAFDTAAIACANQFHWPPMIHDGEPIEATWVMAAHWMPKWHFIITPAKADETEPECRIHYVPSTQAYFVAIPTSEPVFLSYTIAPDGSTKNVKLLRPNRIDYVNTAAIDCVSGWKFFPVLRDGVPVDVDRTIQINWQFSGRR